MVVSWALFDISSVPGMILQEALRGVVTLLHEDILTNTIVTFRTVLNLT